MKKSFVFVPATVLLLVLLNAFVLKDDDAAKAPVAAASKKKPAPESVAFKSADGGQTWQKISGAMPKLEERANIAALEGVLVATGQKGIKRSADRGNHWQWAISEGGVGIAVERIEGGFAAISYSEQAKSRRVRISLDKGKTWQAIDEGLRPSGLISSVKQMGRYLFVGHPDGIFRSDDMGKTWNLVHPGLELDKKDSLFMADWMSPRQEPGRVFKIQVSGNIVYAVAVNAGC